MQVDLIFFNGNVLTQDEVFPKAQAVAIAGGRFLAVGKNEEVLSLSQDTTEVIDLEGQTLLPGFADSHLHLGNLGAAMETVNLSSASGAADIVRLGSEFLAARPSLVWLSGWGWNHNKFVDGALPSRHDLDQISSELPILFSRTCGHIAVANSYALTLAGLTSDPKQPEGGHIDLDEAGFPTGILRESAIGLVRNLAPQPTVADYKRFLAQGAEQAASFGLTSVHSDDLGNRFADVLTAYQELVAEDKLPLRVTLQIRLYDPKQVDEFLEVSSGFSFPPHTVDYGPVKVMTDGSLGARTAALLAPYADDSSTSGVEVLTPAAVTAILGRAHERGLQMSGHAIGDKAIDTLLTAFETALSKQPKGDARPRVIHAQLTTPEQLERIKALGAVCDIQPVFVGTDLHVVEQRIGTERMQSTYAWRTMQELGIPTAGGSDSPVESCNPLIGIQQAVTRQDMAGFPAGGWLPEQRLTTAEALRLFTVGTAYSAFNENILGSITVGKLADCVVLDRDPLTCPPEEIGAISVQATYVGGVLRFKQN